MFGEGIVVVVVNKKSWGRGEGEDAAAVDTASDDSFSSSIATTKWSQSSHCLCSSAGGPLAGNGGVAGNGGAVSVSALSCCRVATQPHWSLGGLGGVLVLVSSVRAAARARSARPRRAETSSSVALAVPALLLGLAMIDSGGDMGKGVGPDGG